ncbi:MAG: class I SAM-dependent methyltransferase [Elusimicrobiaceae bacterium]|nr:class I SAM-dependent methyltransferase [Elusimicrobiaceae bacterium]
MENPYTNGSYLVRNPSWHSEDAPWKLAHILRALKKAHVPAFSTVLDAGCGSGAVIKAWAAQNPHLKFTGWDISPQAHALAVQEVPPHVHFVQGENFPSGRFDLALAVDVIEHVENPADWLTRLSACASVLVLHVPLDLSLRSWLNPDLLEKERQSVGHIHFFTARSLKKFLREQQCKVICAHYTNKYVERPPKLMCLKSRLGMAIRQLVHYLLPRAWAAYVVGGYSLMVVAQPIRGTDCAGV